ncbi:hypothetical protein ACHAXR_003667 [Thalassiosira sp. AJA248-18]
MSFTTMISMSVLQNPTNGGYQSIPDTKDRPQPNNFSRRRRCIKYKSFAWGILVGISLMWVDTFYEKAHSFYNRKKHYDGRSYTVNHRKGPRHSGSGALHNILHGPHHRAKVSIGPRPYFLINEMDDDDDDDTNPNNNIGFVRPDLKETLQKCAHKLKSFQPSDFVLGHRGAALQFPEHTDRSHDAASRMGAGLVECDVNLSKDKQLVCRHERCDLHLTTDVLTVPHLAKKCTQPFRPAKGPRSASAKCCTTDFTLEEIQTQMCGRMSSSNKRAKSAQQYISHHNTPSYRTDLYSHDCPHIQSHKDFIQVVDANGGSFVPEFKMLDYEFNNKRKDGYTRQMFIEQILADYNNTDPARVYPQGFDWEDLYFVANSTSFGINTFALDKNLNTILYSKQQLRLYLQKLVDGGVTAIAPAIFMLLEVNKWGNIVPSPYAEVAQELGLDIIAWSFERSDALSHSKSSWYYSPLSEVLKTDSDMIKVLDVLYEDVDAKAIFTDWPSVVTFYANCKGIALR